MTNHANLELRLNSHELPDQYRVTARLELPGSPVLQEKAGLAQFDTARFSELAGTARWEIYGRELAGALFGPTEVRDLFVKARQETKGQVPLRLRLCIESDAGPLRRLYWELLNDPEHPGSWLATDQTCPFSRHVTSGDERPVARKPFDSLRALVVVANPLDLEDYSGESHQKLSPVDVPGEVARARQALGTIPITLLCSEPGLERDGLPTLKDLLSSLEHDYDVLYLVAHGMLDGDKPQLWLEHPDRQADVVSGHDTPNAFGETVPGLLTRLGKLPVLPRLVILASCESASPGSGGAVQAQEPAGRDTWAWAALGPRLAEIGIPAVIAMQGKVTMRTVDAFMPAFFAALRRDGHIDRAVASARLAVQDRWDWWLPVLFSRLEDGLLFAALQEAPAARRSAPGAARRAPAGGFDTTEQREMLQQELAQHQRNLARLRSQKAIYAAGEEPLRLLNQIDHELAEIQRLQAELDALL